MSSPHIIFTLSFLFLFINAIVQAVVPPSQTFSYVNEGEFGDYIAEYDANYRFLDIAYSPFQLCFYNTTHNAYTLALRMGTRRSESLRRWVWEANRGNPVGENATFSLRADGNLVLAHADGRIAWQSNTSNKGVVGFNLLPNGNMVLYDSRGDFIWQSFDYPTDTLLMGQSLRLNGTYKLVSRLSERENKDGPYSMVLEPRRLALYYKSENSPRPMLYSADFLWYQRETIDLLRFECNPETYAADVAYAYNLQLARPDSGYWSYWTLARPKYNSTLTYLRLGIDGSLRAYTFYPEVDWGAWEETFTIFPREGGWECQLPERCGSFGLCEDSQCVACPSPNGLLGWSKSCAPPKLGSCKSSNVKYYKLEGVDHFLSRFTRGNGPIKEEDCSRRCTSDCKCLGFFYHQVGSRCWIVYDLQTLTKVDNSTHLGYIKTS